MKLNSIQNKNILLDLFIMLYSTIKRFYKALRFIFLSKNVRLAEANRFNYSELVSRSLSYQLTNIKAGNNKVIYTCITGGYDNLIIPTYYNCDWDYICYTDNSELLKEKQKGPWIIKSLAYSESSNAINNRWHKFHPHILFPHYSESVYIDGNLDILDDYLFKEIDSMRDRKLLIPIHFKNDCVYKEINSVKRSKKAKKAQLNKIKKLLKENLFPKHYGLTENNIIYRKHNDALIISVMEQWWELLKVVPRDQLSLSYVLWKHGIIISDIALSNARINIEHYHFYYSDNHY